MKPKLTKTELADRCAALERETWLQYLAIRVLEEMTDPDVPAKAELSPDECYTWRLFEATAFHGGFVIETHHVRDQRPSYRVEYLDTLRARWNESRSWETIDIRSGLDRLVDKRNALVNAPTR